MGRGRGRRAARTCVSSPGGKGRFSWRTRARRFRRWAGGRGFRLSEVRRPVVLCRHPGRRRPERGRLARGPAPAGAGRPGDRGRPERAGRGAGRPRGGARSKARKQPARRTWRSACRRGRWGGARRRRGPHLSGCASKSAWSRSAGGGSPVRARLEWAVVAGEPGGNHGAGPAQRRGCCGLRADRARTLRPHHPRDRRPLRVALDAGRKRRRPSRRCARLWEGRHEPQAQHALRELHGPREVAWNWGELSEQLGRMELRGEVRRGYFVKGLSGVQYALPQAVESLRGARSGLDTSDSSPCCRRSTRQTCTAGTWGCWPRRSQREQRPGKGREPLLRRLRRFVSPALPRRTLSCTGARRPWWARTTAPG